MARARARARARTRARARARVPIRCVTVARAYKGVTVTCGAVTGKLGRYRLELLNDVFPGESSLAHHLEIS